MYTPQIKVFDAVPVSNLFYRLPFEKTMLRSSAKKTPIFFPGEIFF
jgi:hypothetical protein